MPRNVKVWGWQPEFGILFFLIAIVYKI